ncbi:MAG: hypothetical protein NTY77_08795 [Elusimicrobia bacterium]|nr:hypothetical protein [Elusimicrobiota bacterium]
MTRRSISVLALAVAALLILPTWSAAESVCPDEKGDFHAALGRYLQAEKKKGVELAPAYETCEFQPAKKVCLEHVFVLLMKKRLAGKPELATLYESDDAPSQGFTFQRLTPAGCRFARKTAGKAAAGPGFELTVLSDAERFMEEHHFKLDREKGVLTFNRLAKDDDGVLRSKPFEMNFLDPDEKDDNKKTAKVFITTASQPATGREWLDVEATNRDGSKERYQIDPAGKVTQR